MSDATSAGDPVVMVCGSLAQARDAAARLRDAGFAADGLSVVGRREHLPLPSDRDERVRSWGLAGSVWGAVCGLCAGAAVLLLPPVGPVFAAGPLAALLTTAAEGAVLGGGVSAIAAALTSLGLDEDEARRYETDVAASRFLVVVHGDAEAVARARRVLGQAESNGSASQA